MEQAPSPPPVAASPPADEPNPAWPPWFGFAGFGAALVCTIVAVGVIAAVAGIDTEGDSDSAVLTIVGTLIQSVFFIGAALLFTRSVAPPRLWQFGLRRAPLRRTVGWAALGMLAFYGLGAIYVALVHPDAQQEVTQDLGADQSTLGLIAAGVMVIAVAPVVEEVFFRGFFYRALRGRYPIVLAAVIDGFVFGVIHYDFSGADALLLLPPLAILGLIFCLVYERTGTLYATIGMHAVNNTIAFAAQADQGWRVALVVGPAMLVAIPLAARRLPDGPPSLPPPSSRFGPGPQLSLPPR